MDFPESLSPFIPQGSSSFVLSEPSGSGSKIRQIFQLASRQLLEDKGIVLSPEQKKLVSDICKCRTIACGFNMDTCTECGFKRIHYNSCGNRNCPVCGGLRKELWVDERSSEVIDSAYYHAVFTCPHELNSLFLANRKQLFAMFHKCVGQTIMELAADPKYLGAAPGIIQVLHTWSQELLFHPHIHAVISGGGLTADRQLKTLDRDSFFIPESILAAKFRGKFLSMLDNAYSQHGLVLTGAAACLRNHYEWAAFRDRLYQCKWVAKVKETFNGNGNAIEYLGRYTYKVAISDSRIVSVEEDKVVFTARGEDGRQSRTLTVTPLEFVKRFLLHVLPKGFQKIRYYGYLNNRFRKDNLALIFNLQGYRQYIQKYKGLSPAEVIFQKWGHDVTACPHCKAHAMLRLACCRGIRTSPA